MYNFDCSTCSTYAQGSHFGFLKKWKKFQNFGDLNLGLQRGSPLPYPQDHESWIIYRLYFICLIQIPNSSVMLHGRACTCRACRAIKTNMSHVNPVLVTRGEISDFCLCFEMDSSKKGWVTQRANSIQKLLFHFCQKLWVLSTEDVTQMKFRGTWPILGWTPLFQF